MLLNSTSLLHISALLVSFLVVRPSLAFIGPHLAIHHMPTSQRLSKNLISVEEALTLWNEQRNATPQNVVFVDGSWYHKDQNGGTGRTSFETGPRLPKARYLDMDDICCHSDLFPTRNPKGLPHMLPPPDLFSKVMDAFTISNHDHIIVYGRNKDVIFTPRTWFLFRTMGHESVHLMQGSLEDWKQAGGPVDTDPVIVPNARDIWFQSSSTTTRSYQAKTPSNVVNMQDVLKSLNTNDAIIVDPRGSSFKLQGHIPGAIHIPYSEFVEPDHTLKLKSKQNLQQLFEQAGIDVTTEKTIIATCGSGVSVCHVALALEECGRDFQETKIYDGSWAEWGDDPSTPKILPQRGPN